MPPKQVVQSSFRDPSGFLFIENNIIYRQINKSYKDDYDMLIKSGLYKKLCEKGLLIPHEEVQTKPPNPDIAYKVIKPEQISFISYPYEWCFSQLKDAALLTLKIQKIAFKHGMILKDASVYNIQFKCGKPVFIDTLSFEKYQEGLPWIAYGQFCKHFLSPLSLMRFKDIRFNTLLRNYIDGIPLDLTSKLLPFNTRFKFSILMHIHLHAKSQKIYEDKTIKSQNTKRVSRLAFIGIIESLYSSVNKINWKTEHTEWADYYEKTNYSDKALDVKKKIVEDLLMKINPDNVWDLGANIGLFSRIAGKMNIPTISFDIDPAAVELNYRKCKQEKETNITPLLIDLTNPSPGIGWENKERMSFLERGPTDTILALALIHHLAISNNVPFTKIASFFHKICKNLILEFVPKDDSQVQKLLATRQDIFHDYTITNFEYVFSRLFDIKEKFNIKESNRIIYLLHAK